MDNDLLSAILFIIGFLQLAILYVLTRNRDGSQKVRQILREELDQNRQAEDDRQRSARLELQESLKLFGDSLDKRMGGVGETVEKRLVRMQRDNVNQLDRMRETVDEKLQSTLEKRISHSFKQVSDRLEKVHQGLGEMQNLAIGVGDLKKVLSNVKTRGGWGEVQLASLLEEILSPEQYLTNVQVKKGSADRVEFALKIPNEKGGALLLPIDAKFPLEDYERLVDASEGADPIKLQAAVKSLLITIKKEAKKISEKYVDPPHTTDFAVLYLPVEGLYAEIVRQPGLVQQLRMEYKIAIAGPNTILPVLSFVQMGYRTLAIQKRTSEVWELLGAVRTEFGRFGGMLEKTQKKLQEASNVVEDAARKSRTIERKLNRVETLSEGGKKPELPKTENHL